MAIIIKEDGREAKKIDKLEISKEGYLQDYIHKNPEAIPVYDIQEDKKLFVAAREFPTESGPIDALAVDKDGDIYIIETKLYKNPDKRTVVAQALDYGAALWKHFNDFNKFIGILNNESQKIFNMTFQEKITELFELDDDQFDKIRKALEANLDKGNIRFIILMNTIDERLKDLILYINENSNFRIYAVQFDFYRFDKYEIIIPKIYGDEVRKNFGSSSDRIYWDEEGFLKEVENLKPDTKAKILDLFNFAKQENCLGDWGTGKKASFKFKISTPVRTGETTVFSVWSDGFIQIGYWLRRSDEKTLPEVEEFFNMVKKLERLSINLEARTDRLSIEEVSNDALQELKKAVLWLKNKFPKN